MTIRAVGFFIRLLVIEPSIQSWKYIGCKERDPKKTVIFFKLLLGLTNSICPLLEIIPAQKIALRFEYSTKLSGFNKTKLFLVPKKCRFKELFIICLW